MFCRSISAWLQILFHRWFLFVLVLQVTAPRLWSMFLKWWIVIWHYIDNIIYICVSIWTVTRTLVVSLSWYPYIICMYIWRFFSNRGTPKSPILVGFSIINHTAIGVPPFQETPISCISMHIYIYTQIWHCHMIWLITLNYKIVCCFHSSPYPTTQVRRSRFLTTEFSGTLSSVRGSVLPSGCCCCCWCFTW